MTGNTSQTFFSIVSNLVVIINDMARVTAAIAVVVFLFGLALYAGRGSDPKANTMAKGLILWGLVVIFVIFSLYAIEWIACISFLGAALCPAK